MKRLLRYPVMLCLSAGLLGILLAGCSHSGSDFASMTKEQQIQAMHNLPPQEVAIQKKMRDSIMASKNAANGKAPSPPQFPSPGGGQH